jgi:hypothetical protein
MIQNKLNRLHAAKTTALYCVNTASETAGISNFAPVVKLVKGKIVVVEGYKQLSDTPVRGITLNVLAIRETMIERILPLSSAIFAYAASLPVPDNDLMAKAKLSKGYLDNISKEECATESRPHPSARR